MVPSRLASPVALAAGLQAAGAWCDLPGARAPTSWDPFFADYMTLADIYHYPTQHFRFHQRQLTLSPPRG